MDVDYDREEVGGRRRDSRGSEAGVDGPAMNGGGAIVRFGKCGRRSKGQNTKRAARAEELKLRGQRTRTMASKSVSSGERGGRSVGICLGHWRTH
jgi:hypothetical protein